MRSELRDSTCNVCRSDAKDDSVGDVSCRHEASDRNGWVTILYKFLAQ
jgi:hypothetical protein